MAGFHDDRLERNYDSGSGYRSNRDVREGRQDGSDARGRGSAPAGQRRDKDPACRVYVHNLDYGTSWQDLKDHMRGAGGQVEYVKIMQDPDGRSKGYGVCEYTNRQDAQDAIEQLDNSTLQGRQIGLRADRDADGHSGRDAARGDDRSGRRDTDYRSRGDYSHRSTRDEGRSDRRDRSPGRDRNRDRGQDRSRRDDDRRDSRRDDREPRRRESRSAKSAEELDAEMDAHMSDKKQAAAVE